MKSIQIREAPEPLYRAVAKAAEEEGRSISQQALMLLSKGAGVDISGQARRKKLIAEFEPIEISSSFDASAELSKDRSR